MPGTVANNMTFVNPGLLLSSVGTLCFIFILLTDKFDMSVCEFCSSTISILLLSLVSSLPCYIIFI